MTRPRSEALSGRLTASEGSASVLAPLHLGTAGRGEPELSAEVVERGPLPTCALITTRAGAVHIGPRGAEALAEWLHLFANPTPKLELWGIEGIMRKCKVSRSTAYAWVAKPDFPQPVPVLGGNGRVWEAGAVRAWVRHLRREGGRPKKQRPRRSR